MAWVEQKYLILKQMTKDSFFLINSILAVCLDTIANFLKASKYEIIIIFVETHFPVESLMLCPNCIQRSNYGYQTLQLEHKVINIGN